MLADRIVFLPSASFTGLYPADSFRWKDQIYSLHRIVDHVTVQNAHESAFASLADRPDLPFSEADVKRIVRAAKAVFEDTAAYSAAGSTSAWRVSVSRIASAAAELPRRSRRSNFQSRFGPS